MMRLMAPLLALAACAETPAPVALADRTWAAVEIGGEAVPAAIAEPITLRVAGDKVSGFAGCNRFGGAATVSGAKVQFLQLISTRMACLGDGVMATEAAYLDALGAAASASLDGQGRLVLLSADGEALAVFAPAPDDGAAKAG
jgi:heat shock protein HslJ